MAETFLFGPWLFEAKFGDAAIGLQQILFFPADQREFGIRSDHPANVLHYAFG